jgi:predicted AAA+ superfamily ATPase
MFPRILTSQLKEAIKYFPVVLVTGARRVGKSTLVMKLLGNYITFDDITIYLSAKEDPISFVKSLEKPVILDEVQRVPEVLLPIKQDVDEQRKNGSYILTGSANVLGFKNLADTLAGRMAILELFPLTSKEINGKTEDVLEVLFNRTFSQMASDIDENFLIERILAGGYPEVNNIDTVGGRYLWFSSYITTYVERDVRDIGELRNIDKFFRTLNLLASRSAGILRKTDIAKSSGIDVKTLDNYLKLLKLVYIIYLLKPYSENIGKRFIKSEKIFFIDSGLLSHLLGITTKEEFLSSPYKGAIFETFVFSELLKAVKYSTVPSEIFFYRTQDGKEIDFIIKRGERIIAIEIKFSKTVSKADFKHIVDLKACLQKDITGFVIYTGKHILPFGKDLYALPVGILF